MDDKELIRIVETEIDAQLKVRSLAEIDPAVLARRVWEKAEGRPALWLLVHKITRERLIARGAVLPPPEE